MITCQVISSVIEMFLVMTCLDLAEKRIEHIACVQPDSDHLKLAHNCFWVCRYILVLEQTLNFCMLIWQTGLIFITSSQKFHFHNWSGVPGAALPFRVYFEKGVEIKYVEA